MGSIAMTYREAVVADAAGIATVGIASMRSAYRGILPDDFLDQLSYEQREASLRARLASAGVNVTIVAADDDGTIIGYAVAGPERSGNGEYDGELLDLYFLPDHQGRGHGRTLTLICAERLLDAGRSSMLVWVLADNPGRRFYDALGGRVVGERELTIGGRNVMAIGYGWPDLRAFVTAERARRPSEASA